MPYFDCIIPKDFLSDLSKSTDSIAEEMLTEAIPILAESLVDEIKKHHEVSGDLWRSIEVSKPYKFKDEVWVVSAYPTGKSKNLKSQPKQFARSKKGKLTSGVALFNDDKLWWLEYGNKTQPPHPVLAKATNNASSAVVDKLIEVFNKGVEK